MIFKTADLCDEHEDLVQIAEPGLIPFGQRQRFYGEIVTLKLFEDNSLVREAVATDGQGKVLVVDGGGSLRCALLGDLLAAKAVANHWSGMIINGCIRDSADIDEMDIGVRAITTCPLKSIKKGVGEKDIPVRFLGVSFQPGEYVYVDEDELLVFTGDGARRIMKLADLTGAPLTPAQTGLTPGGFRRANPR